MNLQDFLQQILTFTGTFNFHLVLFLFIICAIGEFSISVPYLLETVWLLSGYNLGTGTLSPYQIVLLWLAAQAGRQVGAIALYHVSRLGSTPIMKFYQKHFEAKLSEKLSENNSLPLKLIRKIDFSSPFSIALGRLFWLRIPITVTLGIKGKRGILSAGVLISSLAWDSVYISIGVAGGNAILKPTQMILYSLIGLTILYGITFAIRHFSKRRASRNA